MKRQQQNPLMRRPRFTGQTVLVTGGSSGIGFAIAFCFASEGADIVLVARNRERLEKAGLELQKSFSVRILPASCDVTNPTQVARVMADAFQRFGRLDILVNNAGIGLIAPVERVQVEDARTLFETNFFGALICMQAAFPYFRRQGRGHVVNIASLAGLRGIPNSGLYAATKAALIALSDSARIEWRKYKIRVTVICPGRVRLGETGFFAAARKYGDVRLYKAPEITAKAVADATVEAVRSNKRLVVLPMHARLTYCLHKCAPAVLDRILHRKMPRLEVASRP
ncbi:MAG: SDR family NAD(P)-dependent oxidoreductase [Verrucomicrobiae bacterium]|nr:SDR family NAD(P)-dependent oxidoreductase [Verrucomicrobiae bacterium]